MKKTLLSILFIFTCFIFFTEEEIDTKSDIVHVKVYPEWAYVTRKSNITIGSGTYKLLFKHLPSWIDTESIQAKIEPFNGIKIIGITTNTIYLKEITEEDVLDVQKKVIDLRDKLEDLNTELKAIDEEKKYLTGLIKWEIEKDQLEKSAGKLNISDIQSMTNYIKEAILENLKMKNKIERKIRELNPEITAWENKWRELQSRAKLEEKEIVLEIESDRNTAIDVFVGYLISGASWYPVYDARTDINSNDIDILYEAIIQQSTGENWANANFTLSTIKPYLIKEKPDLNPWYINEQNVEQSYNNKFIRGSNDNYYNSLKIIQQKQKDTINYYNNNSEEAYTQYQDNYMNAIEVIEQAEERGTTVEFDIPGKYTVKTDGNPVRVFIGQASIKAEKKFTAVPAVSMSTYVATTMRNNSKFPFLPGVVKIYKGSNFIGKSKINFVAENEKFELYMGLEERIKVSRILNAKKSATNALGNKKILKVGYNIEVQNFLNEESIIEISDQVPVSQNDSIKVKITDIDPKIEKTEKGILKWNVVLKPMEKKILYFEFEIEYPSNIILDNADEIEKQLKSLY